MMDDTLKMRVFAVVVFVFSVVVAVAMVPELNEYGAEAVMLAAENEFMYEKVIHILAMLVMGFGFLMVFAKKYCYSTITSTYLLVALSLPLYMLIRPYLWGTGADLALTNISMLLFAEFAAASLLIAIGGPLCRINTSQYLLIGLLFTPIYAINEWILLSGSVIPEGAFLDTAGSVVIHAFGAYFAFGMITMLSKRGATDVSTSKISNQFAMLGSAVLWIFWPSFCSALVAVEQIPLVAVNTVLALCGSTLSTYVFSLLIRGKVEIADIANASLAGGVAIGATVADVAPGWSMLIGLVAGIISVVGFTMIQPRLEKLTGGVDTCGVHNLHGMTGVFGGLVAVLLVASPTWQLTGVLFTMVFAVIMGVIVGFITSKLGSAKAPKDDTAEFCIE